MHVSDSEFSNTNLCPLSSFKPTEDNAEIEHLLQAKLDKEYLECLECLQWFFWWPDPDNLCWTESLVTLLAEGYQEVFYPRLEKIRNDFYFFLLEYGLEVDKERADFVLILGQKEGMLKVPLLLFEEQYLFDTLDEATPQLSKSAEKIFSQQISVDEKHYGFESTYILAMSQKDRRVKLIHYQRPKQDRDLEIGVKHSFCFQK